jgi:hypothetical protein
MRGGPKPRTGAPFGLRATASTGCADTLICIGTALATAPTRRRSQSPNSRVRPPPCARSHSSSRRLAAGDRLGDVSIAPPPASARSQCHESERQPRRRRRSLSSSRRLAADARNQRIALVGSPRLVRAEQAPSRGLASRALRSPASSTLRARQRRVCICTDTQRSAGATALVVAKLRSLASREASPAFTFGRASAAAAPRDCLCPFPAAQLERPSRRRRGCFASPATTSSSASRTASVLAAEGDRG